MLPGPMQRRDSSTVLEEISSKLTLLCSYQQKLIQDTRDNSRKRQAEYTSIGDINAITSQGAYPAKTLVLNHATTNTFEVNTIVVCLVDATTVGNIANIILGNLTIPLQGSASAGATCGIYVIPGLRIPLQHTDLRMLTYKGAVTNTPAFFGLFGVQQGDAYAIG